MFTTHRPALIDRLLEEYEQTGELPRIAGGDHDPDSSPDPKDPPKDPKEPPKAPEITPEVQTFINGLLAEERRKERERLEREAEAAKEQERQEREQREAEERGEFDKVKASLEEQIGTISGERDQYKTEHEALSKYFETQFAQALEDLPEAVTIFRPAEDAPFAEKVAWLEKAQEAARKVSGSRGPGNPPNPRPRNDEDERKQREAEQRRRTASKYRV